MKTLITNGTVVNATGTGQADVLIENEKISALFTPGTYEAGADKIIDAAGKYVIPGGIDAHTHMQMPFGGTNASDTFETGTRAAAWGGTTTIIDFAIQKQGQRVEDGLETWHGLADGECAVDYSFHQVIGGVDDSSLKAMEKLVDEG